MGDGTSAPTAGGAPASTTASAATAGGSVAGPSLAVAGLSVEFASDRGWLRVVDDVSFGVGAGEKVGLVGESGSGKSVTSLAIMGLLPKTGSRVEGTVRFGDDVLTSLSKRAMERRRGREISMIFQEPMTSLNPAFTIGDQIGTAVRRHLGLNRRLARQRAAEMLDLVRIPNAVGRLDEYPHQLSGGMRQRAMIALALSCRPRLLIADEPTTALDVTVQAQILDLLRETTDELDMSVLFITHDLGVVADICDRVVVMYAGQVVEDGSAESVFLDPQHPYSEGLLQAMPSVESDDDRQLAVIPGTVPPPWEFPVGCRFADRCAYAKPQCAAPVPLVVSGDAGASDDAVDADADADAGVDADADAGDVRRVRCRRHAELSLQGAS